MTLRLVSISPTSGTGNLTILDKHLLFLPLRSRFEDAYRSFCWWMIAVAVMGPAHRKGAIRKPKTARLYAPDAGYQLKSSGVGSTRHTISTVARIQQAMKLYRSPSSAIECMYETRIVSKLYDLLSCDWRRVIWPSITMVNEIHQMSWVAMLMRWEEHLPIRQLPFLFHPFAFHHHTVLGSMWVFL